MNAKRDQWAEWLLERRHGGDERQFEELLPVLAEFQRRVVSGAEIRDGDVVLDVGTGDGLIAFAALGKVGAAGRVVFSDVSQDLLDECEALARRLDVLGRCDFVRASADSLPLPDRSVDVVTTRSVLIYLTDKAPAFSEFHRVLKAGGRLSIFEPINIFGYEQCRKLYYGLDVRPVQHLADKITSWKGPKEHPLLNFDERDLFRFAEEAGFEEIQMDYRAEVKQEPWTRSWETFLRSSGNPLDPTPAEEIHANLNARERAEFLAYLKAQIQERPLVVGRSAGWRVQPTRAAPGSRKVLLPTSPCHAVPRRASYDDHVRRTCVAAHAQNGATDSADSSTNTPESARRADLRTPRGTGGLAKLLTIDTEYATFVTICGAISSQRGE